MPRLPSPRIRPAYGMTTPAACGLFRRFALDWPAFDWAKEGTRSRQQVPSVERRSARAGRNFPSQRLSRSLGSFHEITASHHSVCHSLGFYSSPYQPRGAKFPPPPGRLLVIVTLPRCLPPWRLVPAGERTKLQASRPTPASFRLE